ncbi:MAG: ABC transporter ATP-binding protein [Gorillibacterium sp.]|nr:ABC transporter ATP-binding protein [Gorillibacterium sp.]
MNHRGVEEIDFSMSRGEIVGFLGPNGAGKTTTMRMITGYLNPSSGSILVDGLSMADNARKVRRKIGYLPETPPLYPEMRVNDYLKFIADLRDIPVREQKKRIGEVIGMLGLEGRERQLIKGLSKGYRQRLGLAQAILHQPDLLILDEPTSGLDPKQIIEIRKLIRELGEKHTVLLSTHILPEINTICNRVLIINQGRIVLDGRPEELAGSMADTFEVNLEVKGPRERILHEIGRIPAVARVIVIGDSNLQVSTAEQAGQLTLTEELDTVLIGEAASPADPSLAEQSLPTEASAPDELSFETSALASADEPDKSSVEPVPVLDWDYEPADLPVDAVFSTADFEPAPVGAPDIALNAPTTVSSPMLTEDASTRTPDPTVTVLLKVTASDRTDLRETLFFRMAELGFPILEMRRISLSLEDIFLKLTTDEPTENATAISTVSDTNDTIGPSSANARIDTAKPSDGPEGADQDA